MDDADLVADAYAWGDLELAHGFHPTKFGTRFSFAPLPRQEVSAARPATPTS